MVYQDPSQLLRRHRIEVGTVLPMNRLGLADPEVGFMHHGGSLQCVLAVLAPHLAGGDSMQFRVDQIYESISSFTIATPPLVEQTGDRVRAAVVWPIHYSQL
jgi:hypothetical protein